MSDLATKSRALLAALDTYREQASKEPCYGMDCADCWVSAKCVIGGNWLPIEVAAVELKRELNNQRKGA